MRNASWPSIKEEITAIRNKYADERRTEILAVSGEVDIEDLIPVESACSPSPSSVM